MYSNGKYASPHIPQLPFALDQLYGDDAEALSVVGLETFRIRAAGVGPQDGAGRRLSDLHQMAGCPFSSKSRDSLAETQKNKVVLTRASFCCQLL